MLFPATFLSSLEACDTILSISLQCSLWHKMINTHVGRTIHAIQPIKQSNKQPSMLARGPTSSTIRRGAVSSQSSGFVASGSGILCCQTRHKGQQHTRRASTRVDYPTDARLREQDKDPNHPESSQKHHHQRIHTREKQEHSQASTE